VNKVIAKVKLPDASELIKNFKLVKHYYELTWEDLNDKEFLKWFKTKDLIPKETSEQIADFRGAFETKQ
jgi:hypothetical protein